MSNRIAPLHHAILWSVLTAVLAFAWTGFAASDDEYYATAGLGWLHQFPYVAHHFGTVRAVIAIPIATMVGLFGESEFTIVLSTCLFLAATASLTLVMLARLIGTTPALVASVLMVTVPLFALKATIPSADLPELFFVASSFWLFWSACHRLDRFWHLAASGASAACAFSAHELTSALLLFYGLLFISGFGIRRSEYWVMAAGFLAIIGAECAYYFVMTGDPLHRFELLLTGTQVQDRAEVGFLKIAGGGTLHVWTPLDPLVMLFTKQEFGALAFFAVPALWWVLRTRRHDHSPTIVAARLLALLAFVWFLFSAIALKNLTLLPRYYMVTAYCLYLVVAIWATHERVNHHRAFLLGATAFVAVNLLAIYVDNKNPRFSERALVEYLSQSSGPVYTDPMTAAKVEWYCRWAGEDCSRVVGMPPPIGSEYFFSSKNALMPNRLASSSRLFQPCKSWQEIWQRAETRKTATVLLQALGLASLLPGGLHSKLTEPNSPVVVFLTTSSAGDCNDSQPDTDPGRSMTGTGHTVSSLQNDSREFMRSPRFFASAGSPILRSKP